ncbi:hypothetical protein CWS35_11085 [Bradyrhizobium sp. SK17]|nr:hypothetical protein CWS35_11085 [Bradyrhizobium sp. SK17]
MERGAMRASAVRFFVIGILSFASAPSFGQAVDPNIQVRIETALPQPEIKPHLPETERITVQRTKTFTTTIERPYTCAEIRSPSPELRAKLAPEKQAMLVDSKVSCKELQTFVGLKKEKVVRHKVVSQTIEKPKPRQTSVSFAFQTQPGFDTNALKANPGKSDGVLNTSAGVTAIIPVAALDSVILTSQVLDQRYATLVSKDSEVFANSATYSHVLNAVRGSDKVVSSGTTVSDLLNLGISSSTVFGSGFHPYQIELATASAALGRTNVDVGGGAICGAPDKEVFCAAQGVAGELDFTTSDVASQRNVALKAQTNVTWQTSVQGLSVTASGYIQGKYFTEVLGGRQDLILQASARADWIDGPFTLSFLVQALQSFSTLRTAQYNSLAFYPVAKIQYSF